MTARKRTLTSPGNLIKTSLITACNPPITLKMKGKKIDDCYFVSLRFDNDGIFSGESETSFFLNVTSNGLVTVARNGRQTIAVMVGIALRARADIYAVKLRWLSFFRVFVQMLLLVIMLRDTFFTTSF